jgi:hypothetical protein
MGYIPPNNNTHTFLEKVYLPPKETAVKYIVVTLVYEQRHVSTKTCHDQAINISSLKN